MKVVVLYRPNSEHSRLTEEFIHEYKTRHMHASVEVLSVDTREGDAVATLYDVMSYPAILILQDNGSVQKFWQGPSLPRTEDVASYM